MPKRQLILSEEESRQLAADLAVIWFASYHNADNISKTISEQIAAYKDFFADVYDEDDREKVWPAPLNQATCHLSSCDRCGQVNATVRVREIVPLPLDSRLLAVSMSLMGSRLEWRCDDCGDTPIRIVRTEVLIDA